MIVRNTFRFGRRLFRTGRRHVALFLAAAFAVSLCLAALSGGMPGAKAATISIDITGLTASQIETGINTAIANGDDVEVTGSASGVSPTIKLVINPGRVVTWKADLAGRAAANNYVMDLTGGGTFTLEGPSTSQTATIANASTSAGGTIYISGTVTLNVNNNGVIDSPTTGSGSAVTVSGGVNGAGINGVVINVNSGGLIRSVPGGYAINDGSGFTQCGNNTKINIPGVPGGTYGDAVVQAGTAGAIRSTGEKSIVTVDTNGLVVSAPSSNVSPVISMNYDPPPLLPPAGTGVYETNVVIKGGRVATTNPGAGSFVIQTSQNVSVDGGLVQSISGRGINLVGEYSKATITGGAVTTVDGVAISSATTTLDKINHTSVVVTGGKVEATGTGDAIQITGTDSTVNVSDGQVLARSGCAIRALSRVADNSITVGGGFVFAWGETVIGTNSTTRVNVIYPAGKLVEPVGGAIVAWKTSTGIGTEPYVEGEQDDLDWLPSGATVTWIKNPVTSPFDGISVTGTDAKLANNFFQLNVEVIRHVYKLTIITTLDGVPEGTPIEIDVPAESAVSIAARPEKPILPNPGSSLPPDTNGDKFFGWVSGGGGTFGDASSRNTSFTMPHEDVTITAEFGSRYLVHVDGLGAGIAEGQRNYVYTGAGVSASYGYYAQNEKITISAAFQSGVAYFNHWSCLTYPAGIADASSRVTTFTMPGAKATVTAEVSLTSVPAPPQHTTYIGSDGKGYTGSLISTTAVPRVAVPNPLEYTGMAGTGLNIEARSPIGNEVFSHWVSSAGGWFADSNSPNTVFVMPEANPTITAVFVPTYTLEVINGTVLEEGPFKAGDVVHITADSAHANQRFAGWTVSPGAPAATPPAHFSATTFTMPARDVTITANFAKYDVWVWNGVDWDGADISTGAAAATHDAGDIVYIKADEAPPGLHFNGWLVAYGNPKFNRTLAQTSFIMPADDVILIAVYSDSPLVLGWGEGFETRAPKKTVQTPEVIQIK